MQRKLGWVVIASLSNNFCETQNKKFINKFINTNFHFDPVQQLQPADEAHQLEPRQVRQRRSQIRNFVRLLRGGPKEIGIAPETSQVRVRRFLSLQR